MKILVITNLYPPYYVGGYELACRDVVEGLKDRGHKIKVITSTYGVNKRQSDGEIYRWLQVDVGQKAQKGTFAKLIQFLRKEVNNQLAFNRLCNSFCPDVVYVWNLAYVSIAITVMTQCNKLPVCYFILDKWLLTDPWYKLWNHQVSKALIKFGMTLLRFLFNATSLRLSSSSSGLYYVRFVSEHLKRQYLKKADLKVLKPVTDGAVIYLGIDVNQFSYKKIAHFNGRLLYVGQIVRHKGVHTLIKALEVIVNQRGYESVTLTIVGGTIIPDYEVYVRHLVSSLGLENNVYFAGSFSREKLPSIYHEHDILIFPSVWDEPLGLTQLEAMSSGLAVVGTGTGGSSEILQDEVNALVFPKENAEVCATQVLRLIDNPELFEKIRQNGRRTVEEKFNFKNMMDKLDAALQEAVTSGVI